MMGKGWGSEDANVQPWTDRATKPIQLRAGKAAAVKEAETPQCAKENHPIGGDWLGLGYNPTLGRHMSALAEVDRLSFLKCLAEVCGSCEK